MTEWVLVHIGLLWTSKEIIKDLDSVGLNCPKEIIKVSNTLNLNYVYNSTQYQDFSSVLCGRYCLYYMNVHSVGTTCYNVVKKFFPTDDNWPQCDDEAVTLGQMKDITDKKIDMDNLSPQTLTNQVINTRLWQRW